MQLDLLANVNFNGPSSLRNSDQKAPVNYDGKLIMSVPDESRKQARYSISFAKFFKNTGITAKTVAFGFTPSGEAIVTFDNEKYAANNMLISSSNIAENKARITHIFEMLKIVTPTKEMPVVTAYFNLVKLVDGIYRVDVKIPDEINALKVERIKKPLNIPGSGNF
jgi:hypothetical protein